jgi:hypothetical protein
MDGWTDGLWRALNRPAPGVRSWLRAHPDTVNVAVSRDGDSGARTSSSIVVVMDDREAASNVSAISFFPRVVLQYV